MAGYILQQKANDGDPLAEHELGLRFLLGKGFEKDTSKAIYWIRRAASKNLTAARFNYGVMQNNGIGTEWNPFSAYKNIKFAAKNGMPEGAFLYGIFLTDNLVVSRNYSEAYKWIKKAADDDHKEAKKVLKNFKKMGIKPPADSTVIIENDNAQLLSASTLLSNNWEFDYFEFEDDTAAKKEKRAEIKEVLNKNSKEIRRKFGISDNTAKKEIADTSATGIIDYALQQGSPEAYLFSARDLEEGITRKQDRVKAAFYYLRSFRLGSVKAAQYLLKLGQKEGFYEELKKRVDKEEPEAMFVWGGLAALGIDYRITHEQAFGMFRKAAEKNHIPSLIEIGMCYYKGTLVEKDIPKGIETWQKAEALGSVEAKIRITLNTIVNANPQTDLSSEIDFLNKCSSQGSVLAETVLGYCYENGVGVNKSKAMAAEKYRNASNRGNETAFNSLRKLYDDMRPEEAEFVIYE